jgi:hypothetical protein
VVRSPDGKALASAGHFPSLSWGPWTGELRVARFPANSCLSTLRAVLSAAAASLALALCAGVGVQCDPLLVPDTPAERQTPEPATPLDGQGAPVLSAHAGLPTGEALHESRLTPRGAAPRSVVSNTLCIPQVGALPGQYRPRLTRSVGPDAPVPSAPLHLLFCTWLT